MIVLNHEVLPLSHVFGCIRLYLVYFRQLAQTLNELVGGAGFLWLEEAEPEDLSIDTGAQLAANLLSQVIVYNILEIDRVELVGPWMEHLEALVVHVLRSKSFNILLNEFKVSLVRFDGIAQIIFVNRLLVVPEERANGLDARSALQILRCK